MHYPGYRKVGVGREEKESRLGKVQESSQIGQLEVRFGDGTSEQVANGIHRLGKRRIFHSSPNVHAYRLRAFASLALVLNALH